MDIKEIRRKNLRTLVMQYGDQKGLAEAADVSPNQLNHLIGPNPIRNLGEKLARKIEANLGLQEGYLDHVDTSAETVLNNIFSNQDSIIPIVDIVIKDGVPIVKSRESSLGSALKTDWAICQGYNSESMLGFEHVGNNMSPQILNGDTVIIDTKQLNIIHGEAYLLSIHDEVYIKRIFKSLDGGLCISSDNVDKMVHPSIEVSADQIHLVHILGRVAGLVRKLPLQ